MSNLSVGIVGLPNAGKSTLFNALLGRQIARAENYPFCTIEPNTGVVEVPDERLSVLARIEKSKQIVPAVVKFVDIAGLVKGAAKGEGLGNKFLAHIRECSIICYVLRSFADSNVEKAGSINPRSDLEILKTELMLKDLETIERILGEKVHPDDKKEVLRHQTAEKTKKILDQGKMPVSEEWNDNERTVLQSFSLLTMKPYLVVFNIGEEDFENLDKIRTDFSDWDVIPISAKMEEELAELEENERREYLKSWGVKESGLVLLIRKAYEKLGLVSFYTAGEKEARAWTVEKETKAPQAAAVIHTDFEKGFIKAEVVDYNTFVQFGGWAKCRSLGKTCFKGKDYLLQGNEVVEFKVSC
ncbi:redox-regulated ATPase YchF [Candidatus Shapirobacteria bacterium CG09_land_8_20_14_0_10_38_17]|uniref:Redox-regulated ATPase YchF n=1 Tax=Candidatus Shapirobacteria bacterium CG09_land_8_20_14_0_10_38_17 TaxID=1974884 RepID=A0A2H0WQY8_9BACT|nr:MAG: redox-regulated ATPase YchF [Candidatus Shapirobacteria bacterium CG09_land_8_20_14_0_10_38_17]